MAGTPGSHLTDSRARPWTPESGDEGRPLRAHCLSGAPRPVLSGIEERWKLVATNLVRDHWRKAERERRAFGSVTAGTTAGPLTFPVQDVEVRSLIGSLPPRLRNPFLLRYYGGFGIQEVAELLHRPAGTIKYDLFEARAKLKKPLGDRDG